MSRDAADSSQTAQPQLYGEGDTAPEAEEQAAPSPSPAITPSPSPVTAEIGESGAVYEPEPYAQEVPTTIINHNYYPRWHYEYKSQRTLFGLPLVHVRLGDRGFGVAKGIFAVGNVAVGLFALGGISLGLFSLGGVSMGLLLALGAAFFAVTWLLLRRAMIRPAK